jgi:hypothetical protein
VLGGDDQVAGQHHLETAAHGHPVHGGDHRLVEVEHLGEPGEPTGAEVGGGILVAGRGGLEVHPAEKKRSPAPVKMPTLS